MFLQNSVLALFIQRVSVASFGTISYATENGHVVRPKKYTPYTLMKGA